MIREVNATDGMDMLVITGKNNYQRNDANTVEPLSRGAVVWLAAVVAKTDAKNKKHNITRLQRVCWKPALVNRQTKLKYIIMYHKAIRSNILNRRFGGGTVFQSRIVHGSDKNCFAATTTYNSFLPLSDDSRGRAISTVSNIFHPVYRAHSRNCACCQFPSSINHNKSSIVSQSPSPQNEGKYIRHMSTDKKAGDEEGSGLLKNSSSDVDSSSGNGGTFLSGLPGSQTGGKKLAIVFTCTVCNTRAAKQFTEQAYLHGVVLVKCPGCQNQHLIADNLSMFTNDNETDGDGGGWNIQKAMAKLGQNVTTVSDGNVLELTLDQVIGEEKLKETIGHGERLSSSYDSNSNSDEPDPDATKQ